MVIVTALRTTVVHADSTESSSQTIPCRAPGHWLVNIVCRARGRIVAVEEELVGTLSGLEVVQD